MEAWLRRPPGAAARITGQTLEQALSDPIARRGVGRALRSAPTILRDRSIVPPGVEAQLMLLERHHA
ncbi:MAG: hypothetical protein AVDCRST_MAG18-1367 [uncultured Thermomicrobiales bacterium]|uniref:Uncharacterized protein n=1 Tax=uncultured Thermomicrobiales bacterium TaxID=1645740 RepID=A0A6J4V1X5_9BACT|nr:MAG: hypothetical protein AVDCRST_MAG18-1367 [uncultured Thermomicrobiales bacterium]